MTTVRNACALLLLASTACATGFATPRQLDVRDTGPAACRKSCGELDLEMGALVLTFNAAPSCVCVPKQRPGTLTAEAERRSEIAGAAAAAAEEQRRAKEEEDLAALQKQANLH
jgi:hypothetical protein